MLELGTDSYMEVVPAPEGGRATTLWTMLLHYGSFSPRRILANRSRFLT
jgi:hypothetical protein